MRPARGLGSAQGVDPNYTFSADEPADHAIGRSRGGLTTKIHALTDQHCSPLTVQLTAGQAGDNPMLWPLLEEHRSTSRDPLRLLCDKAYSHNSTRELLSSLDGEAEKRLAQEQGLSWWPPTVLRPRALPPPQHRRARVQPAQAVARHRHPLRQVRPDLPRRRHPRRDRHPPPSPQLTDTL